jgi:hypothetical protein
MTEFDGAQLAEAGALGTLMDAHDAVMWRCLTELRKWHDPDDEAPLYRPEDELLVVPGNLLVYGGASVQWQTLIGNGTGTGGGALTFYNNANAAIGVGDSATAAAAGQTDLQAATNRLRKGMDATYPQHTDGTAVANNTITFRSTFGNAEANFTWNEWGVFNSPTAATGRMLNRAVQALGAKASGSWQLTVTLSLA